MAIFNPDQNPVFPDYTNESKGFKADTAAAEAFADAGNLAMAGVKIWDRENQTQIQKQVNSEIDQLNNEWGTAVSAFETNVNSQNIQPLPQDLQRYAKQFGDVRKAYLNGTLKDSYYQARIDSMSRQIRARYPGYREQIDGIIQKTLNLSTANDLRKSMMREWDAELANATEDDKAFRSEVIAGSKAGVLPADYIQREAAGKPYTKEETRAFMYARYAQDAEVDRMKKQLEVEDKQSERGKKLVFDTANAEIALLTSRGLEGAYTVAGDTFQGIQQKLHQGLIKPYTAEEKAQIALKVTEAKDQVSLEISRRLMSPEYASLTPQQRKDLTAGAMEQWDALAANIRDQQFGMLNWSKSVNDSTVQDRISQMYGQYPELVLGKAVASVTGGSAVLDSLLLGNPQFKDSFSNALMGVLTAQSMDPKTTSLKQVINGAQAKAGDDLEPAVIKQTVRNAVETVTSKDASLEVSLNGARIMFSPENQDFLGDYTLKSQMDLMELMLSPRMTEKITELGKSDPQVFKNYVQWALNSSQALFNQDVQTMVDVNKFGNDIQFKQNPKTGEFELIPGNSRRTINAADEIYGKWANSEASDAMNRVNRYIRMMKPIVEADGGDIGTAMTAVFDRLGVNRQENVGGLFSRMYEAMAKGQKPQSGLNRKEAYEKAISAPSPELNNIDLDKTGSGQMGSGSKLKETIAKAEGGKSYNTRFGGAQDIELSNYDVGDVMEMGKMFSKKKGSSAMGKYQFMADTLKRLVDLGVVQEDEMFTPALQEKMADYLIAEATNGETSSEGRAKKLAKVWASLPQGPDNTSPYTGVGLNKGPTISWDELMKAF